METGEEREKEPSGAVRGELLRLAWPIAVSTLSYATMSLVDTLFVGRIGTSELAGVALGSMAFFTVICFPMGILKGGKVLVSQAFGAGDEDGAARFAMAGIWLGAIMAALATVAGGFVAETLPGISAGPSGEAARAYARVRAFGALPVMIFVALREARYGYGDSRSPMRAMLLGNGINIGLDALLIFGLGWGVEGAAWATVASAAFQAAWLWPGRSRGLAHLGALRAVWRIGLPTGIQFSMEVGSFALLAALLAGLGERELGAHQIAFQVVHFGFLPLMAIGEAASVMAGHAVGARRAGRVRPIGIEGLKVAALYGGFFSLVLLAFAEPMAAAFTEDAELRAAAVTLLHLAIAFQLADAAAVVARGVLRGMGDVTFAAAVSIVAAWVCTPPLTWLLGYELGLGAVGGWIGLTLECFVAAAIFWRRLLGRGRLVVPLTNEAGEARDPQPQPSS